LVKRASSRWKPQGGTTSTTRSDPQWLTCDFAPVKTLAQPVSLETIKADSRLAGIALICQPRLAVMPVTEAEVKIIIEDASAAKSPKLG
jgi:predicted RNA-binding protein with PUA-like domain